MIFHFVHTGGGGVHGFIGGGMRGFIRGEGHAWFYWGVCVRGFIGGVCVRGFTWFYSGGHAWFYSAGACVVLFMHGFFRYNEIRSMSGRASRLRHRQTVNIVPMERTVSRREWVLYPFCPSNGLFPLTQC